MRQSYIIVNHDQVEWTITEERHKSR